MSMLSFQRILVATDFSETSNRALDYAVGLAQKFGATVTLMHAYEIPVFGFPDGAMIATVDVASRISTAAQQALAAAAESRAASGVKIETTLRDGVAWEEVNRVAEEAGADLIVIGTHGRKGLARALLGSVAENIIRTAKRPVLTIHGPRED
jgi:nucleotide-binding universal stress UspA family protein